LRVNDITLAMADLRFRAKAIRLARKGKGQRPARTGVSSPVLVNHADADAVSVESKFVR
jgi:hypothetical protein